MAIGYEEMHDVAGGEHGGVPHSLQRRCLVTGLESTTAGGLVAEILASEALPNSSVTINGKRMELVRRDVQINSIDSAVGTAWLNLYYERGADDAMEIRRGGRASVRQIQTSRTREGNTVKVSYNGKDQVANLSVFLPCAEPYIETIERTDAPDALALQWVGTVNSTAWRGRPAGQWLCTDASYELIREPSQPLEKPTWRFHWSFQLADDSVGWLPVVVYIDPETGMAPPDASLDGDKGMKKIPYYYETDFGAKFE